MSSNWTDAPLRYRKLMLMFLVQCHRPMEVQAKPFYDINLHAFSDVSSTLTLFSPLTDLCPSFFAVYKENLLYAHHNAGHESKKVDAVIERNLNNKFFSSLISLLLWPPPFLIRVLVFGGFIEEWRVQIIQDFMLQLHRRTFAFFYW